MLLAQIAGVTSRIGLATAVLPVWSRTPAAIAMAAAGLQRASDGRFALGLGASSPPLVEGLHGITWQQPVDRLRTTLVAVRRCSTARACRSTERTSGRFGWAHRPNGAVPIFLAALAPSSVRLAGELADHWLPFLWARSRLPDGRALLAEGEALAEASERRPALPPVSRSRSPKTRRRPGRSPLVGCSRTSRAWAPVSADAPGSVRLRAEVDALLAANDSGGSPRLPRQRSAWLEM